MNRRRDKKERGRLCRPRSLRLTGLFGHDLAVRAAARDTQARDGVYKLVELCVTVDAHVEIAVALADFLPQSGEADALFPVLADFSRACGRSP